LTRWKNEQRRRIRRESEMSWVPDEYYGRSYNGSDKEELFPNSCRSASSTDDESEMHALTVENRAHSCAELGWAPAPEEQPSKIPNGKPDRRGSGMRSQTSFFSS